MSRSAMVIGLLLALNLGALLHVVQSRRNSRVPEASAATVDTALNPLVLEPVVVTVTNQFHWAQLESEDYPTYIARLRSIGCPEETIRDILIADLDQLMATRLLEANPPRKGLKYWQPVEEELANETDQKERRRLEREVDWEKRELLRELIGADLVSERLKAKGQEDYYDRRLEFLPPDKRMQARALIEQFNDQDLAIREKQWEEGTPLTEEDRVELRHIRQEREAALTGLLTPQEKEQFDLWMSDSASWARRGFYGTDATEQEFLKVYELRRGFDAVWNRDDLDLTNPALTQAWEQANAQLQAQIRSQLGPQRYAEFQRGQDLDFHVLNSTATRYKLPRETAAQVYNVKQTLKAMENNVLTDSSVPVEDKELVLRAMREETQKTVRGILGERGFNYYRLRTDWLSD